MDKSIILELQAEAISPDIQLTALLRKAYLVAAKLKIKDFQVWIDKELNGYASGDKNIPNYRLIYGELKCFNFVHQSWESVIPPKGEDDIYTTMKMWQPISELVELSLTTGQLKSSLQSETIYALSEACNRKSEYALIWSNACLHNIISAVKNIILKWAIQLEDDGIIGDGLSFSPKEQTSSITHNYTVNNFYNGVSSLQVQQNSPNNVQNISVINFNVSQIQELLDYIQNNTQSLKEAGLNMDALNKELNTVKTEIGKDHQNHSTIRKSLQYIKTLLTTIATNVVTGQITNLINKII